MGLMSMWKFPGFTRFFAILLVVAGVGASTTTAGNGKGKPGDQKLDSTLRGRAAHLTGRSQVILLAAEGVSPGSIVQLIHTVGGTPGRALPLIGGRVAYVPDSTLLTLAASPLVAGLSDDRKIEGATERTGVTIGATAIRQELGYDGTGVGVAVIDSGVAPAHDDLVAENGGQRVARFVDFVNQRDYAYDDYGHGSHVAGIIAGNGFDSEGARSGIAPGADLVVLKVLDAAGHGRISDVIAAFDYVIANKDELNIRVVNISVATGVYESYLSDPLTVAAEQVVRAGIVVVAAAGNNGRDSLGRVRHGGITAPGNSPWVLTVGASSHMGTVDRADDTMASFSSRGPSAIDVSAKPDLVAPGVGIESLSDPESALYLTRAPYLLPGTIPTPYLPYLSMSGTSMAAPVVTGTIALMLQANPSLTPNAVKAILQYTAERRRGYDPLTQGTGFLNAQGAVQLARYLSDENTDDYPDATNWSRTIIWGNQLLRGGLVRGGRFTAQANAWAPDVKWGDLLTTSGETVEWGVICGDSACDSTRPWRWGEVRSVNVVWGPTCDGMDCQMPWTGNIWGVVDEGDTVVWGTEDEGDTVVWGTSDEDTVVWGTSCSDPDCEPVIWNGQ